MSLFKTLASGAASLANQAAKAVVSGVDRLANRQEFEAVVAATVLIASADGSIDEKEKAAALAAVSTHPAMKSFDAGDVATSFKECVEFLGMDRDLGVATLLDRVKKVTSPEGRLRIVGVATAIASADGNVSEPEQKMIDRIRSIA